mmetsp:Transcript_1978/g.6327  ORF Transcript_1978/g.6327 Transcript_1978/m.6327 type:complete len:224 (-) Transcript_1978:1198-1869(-)
MRRKCRRRRPQQRLFFWRRRRRSFLRHFKRIQRFSAALLFCEQLTRRRLWLIKLLHVFVSVSASAQGAAHSSQSFSFAAFTTFERKTLRLVSQILQGRYTVRVFELLRKSISCVCYHSQGILRRLRHWTWWLADVCEYFLKSAHRARRNAFRRSLTQQKFLVIQSVRRVRVHIHVEFLAHFDYFFVALLTERFHLFLFEVYGGNVKLLDDVRQHIFRLSLDNC